MSEAEAEEWRCQNEKLGFEYRSLSLRRAASAEPHVHEKEIIEYLRNAPNYSAVGCVVTDVLDPNSNVALFPGSNTDGIFVWPLELHYYVKKYHVRLPDDFVKHMESLSWKPPEEHEIDWNRLGLRRSCAGTGEPSAPTSKACDRQQIGSFDPGRSGK